MKFFLSIILLIICQYFFNHIITIDARPSKLKKFSWTFPIHNEHDNDETIEKQLVKRKGLGWGKRNGFVIDNHPYAVHENSARRIWFDDK